MKKPTSDRAADAALVYSDFLMDEGDEQGSNHWRLVGLIQQSIDRTWLEQPQKYPRRQFDLEVGGRTFELSCRFRGGDIIVLLLETVCGVYQFVNSTRVRRTTIFRDRTKAFRNASLRLTVLVF